MSSLNKKRIVAILDAYSEYVNGGMCDFQDPNPEAAKPALAMLDAIDVALKRERAWVLKMESDMQTALEQQMTRPTR